MKSMNFFSLDRNVVELEQKGNLNLFDRVEMILGAHGSSKAWLAKTIGISRQLLNAKLNTPKPQFIAEIAETLNVNQDWLATGQGQIRKKRLYIKVFSFEDACQVGTLGNIDPVDSILVQDGNHEEIFALQLGSYKSMNVKFQPESILLFEKKSSSKNGDYVLAKLEDEDNLVFREFQKENNIIYLHPANPDYEVLKIHKVEKCAIMGVLIEARLKF